MARQRLPSQNSLIQNLRERLVSPEMQVLGSIEDYAVAIARYYLHMPQDEVYMRAEELFNKRDKIPAERKELESKIEGFDKRWNETLKQINGSRPRRPAINPNINIGYGSSANPSKHNPLEYCNV